MSEQLTMNLLIVGMGYVSPRGWKASRFAQIDWICSIKDSDTLILSLFARNIIVAVRLMIWNLTALSRLFTRFPPRQNVLNKTWIFKARIAIPHHAAFAPNTSGGVHRITAERCSYKWSRSDRNRQDLRLMLLRSFKKINQFSLSKMKQKPNKYIVTETLFDKTFSPSLKDFSPFPGFLSRLR